MTGRASQLVVILSAAVLLAAPSVNASAAPGRLVAHVTVDQRRPHTGSSIVATVVVANVGGGPVDSVTVGLYWSDLALLPDRFASPPLAKLLPGRRFSRSFRVKVLGPGVAHIAFTAWSPSGNAAKAEATVVAVGKPLTVALQHPHSGGPPAVSLNRESSTAQYRGSTALTIAGALAGLALLELGVVLHVRRNRRPVG